MVDISAIEKTAATRILLYIYKTKIKNPNQELLMRDLNNNIQAALETIKSTVDFLAFNGLIIAEKEKTLPYKRHINLTSLGQRVAKNLLEVEQAMHNQKIQEEK